MVTGVGAVGAQGTAANILEGDQCALCHLELDDVAMDVTTFFQTDVHARAGLSCVDCHGGNSEAEDEDEAMDEAAGFVGAPGPLEAPAFCARCHSDAGYMRRHEPGLSVDQLTLYRTSVHGIRNAAGDQRVATCVSCHGAHQIMRAIEPKSTVHPLRVAETCGRCHTDPDLMHAYDLPADQMPAYLSSVHAKALFEGGDLSAPTCNDCHGNHGAYPPAVDSVSDICGHCHVNNRDLYRKSVKHDIFEDMDLPACETCHRNHAVNHPTDAWMGFGSESVCVECHDDDDSEPSLAIRSMTASLDSLRIAVEVGHEALDRAHQSGMYTADAEFIWTEARQKLFEARTAVHGFDPGGVQSITADGLVLAVQVQDRGTDAMSQFRFRRTGLLVATLLITILVVALYAKIREIDRRT